MRKQFIFVLVAALMVAMTAGVAQAKGKPAKQPPKKTPPVSYVFRGEVLSVDSDSVLMSVKGGNNFAKPFFGKQLDVAVNARTKIVEDDVRTTLSDLDAGDAVTIKSTAPRGAQSFTANMAVATSPTALYYFDADGDGIGAGTAEEFIVGEEPAGYVVASGDNCADVANPDQADTDSNGIGDACEPAAQEPAPVEGSDPTV